MKWTCPVILMVQMWSLATARGLPQGKPTPQAPREARLDLHGDPLPSGAIARLGTVRLHHEGRIAAIAFSPDGRSIAAACGGEKGLSLRFWQTDTGQELSRIHVDKDRSAFSANGLAFTPDGKGVIIYTCTLKMYDCASGKLLRSFQGVGHAYAFDVSPNGRMLATQVYIGPYYLIHVWDTSTGKELKRLEKQTGSPLGLKFSSEIG